MKAFSTDPIGVGIRGTGQVAIQHIHAIQANPHLFVAAICGRDADKTKAFEQEHAPTAKTYPQYETMLADPAVSAVSICTPNYQHAQEAILALQADKHVIMEKPAGITPEETDALFTAAKGAQRKTVTSFVLRWHPLIRNIRTLLDQEAIGKVTYAEMDYWHGISPKFASYQWIRRKEFAGGAVITGGGHAVDLARYLHTEISEVFAYSAFGREDFDYETTYIASIKFTDGSLGKIGVSLDGLAFPYQFNIDLLGTKGAIRENRMYSQKLLANQNDWVTLPCDTPNSGSVAHHPFTAEFENIADGILNDAPILCPIEDACRTMDVVYAINESARTGKPVQIKPRDS